MEDRAGGEQVAHTWYTRPVLFVADIGRSIRFYTEELGFRKAWHEADGEGTVCQVDRGGCEIVLCEHGARRDKARLFVSLTREAIGTLRREIADRQIHSPRFLNGLWKAFTQERGLARVEATRQVIIGSRA